MYLCKNGIGIRMEKFSGSNDVEFKLLQVTREDSGNYSCVYSAGRHVAHEITAIGQKHVFLQVKEFLSAKMYVRNSIIFEGDSVSLVCTGIGTETHQTLHMYLCKNGIGVSTEVAQGKEGVQFTLKRITRKDSGNYSCVYSFKKYHLVNISSINENSILVQVEETDIHQWWVNVFRLVCSAGVVIVAVTVLIVSQLLGQERSKESMDTPREGLQQDDNDSTCTGPKQLSQ
ncbi:hypothetical protein ACEWY4_026913 [Coilia grayii]|uniref:Ig-like domain-containing protein n=1 Tax=Coilia grayii TaxID=363190 RepID=A0ABD1IS16_9TELE